MSSGTGNGPAKDKGRVLIKVIIVILICAIAVVGKMIWDQMNDEKGTSGMKADFHELAEMNPEVVAWLTVDDTMIDTVICQAEDNTKYLNTDVYGEQTLTGCPFLDYRNDPKLVDRYSIIYGHNVENRLMFSDILLFQDGEFWDKERTGTIELVDGTIYKIRFFACVKAKEDDSSYFDPRMVRNNWEEDFLEGLTEGAEVSKDRIELSDRILVLSTCEEADSEDRVLVLGKLSETGE